MLLVTANVACSIWFCLHPHCLLAALAACMVGTAIRLGDDQTPVSNASELGLPNYQWLPVNLEIELWKQPPADVEEGRFDRSEKFKEINSVEETKGEVRKALKATKDEFGHNIKIGKNMFALNVKSEHTDSDDLKAWNWESEDFADGMLEVSSPTKLSSNETVFAVAFSAHLAKYFYTAKEAATHVHIDGRCLLHDERRLVALLLMWERFHGALWKITHVRSEDMQGSADTLTKRNPELLAFLQGRWNKHNKSVTEAFNRLEGKNLLADEQGLPFALSPEGGRDGYRNLAVNVCHLLDIHCCADCDKNDTPKFGGVEFRMFEAALGDGLRLYITLAERIMQVACNSPLKQMHGLLLLEGVQPSQDAAQLFKQLHLSVAEFDRVFAAEDKAEEIQTARLQKRHGERQERQQQEQQEPDQDQEQEPDPNNRTS